jgi:alginate O-acetyltransferase complex protein AlgI
MIGATPIVKQFVLAIQKKEWGERILMVLEPVVLLTILIAVTAYLVDGSYNPFLYFRF